MTLEKLRRKALAHRSQMCVRYTICLNPDTAEELHRLSELMGAAAQTAAAQAAAADDGIPERRSIGDKGLDLTALTKAAEEAVDKLRSRVQVVMDQAVRDDDLVVLVFAPDPESAESPDRYFAAAKARHRSEDGNLDADALARELVVKSYRRAETGERKPRDLGMTWDDVRTALLGATDLERLDDQVLALYWESPAVPFDPQIFGRPPTN